MPDSQTGEHQLATQVVLTFAGRLYVLSRQMLAGVCNQLGIILLQNEIFSQKRLNASNVWVASNAV